MTDPIAAFLHGHEDELCAFRRHVHSHPELSWAEHDTTDLVRQRLQVAGLDPVVLDGSTGLWCDIGPGEAGAPVIALRADLDALPIDDTKDVPYASKVPGVAHCCGHDVHTTVALGAGLAIAQIVAHSPEALGGTRIRLVFQPAEEAVPGGAQVMKAAGVLEDVIEIYGLHVEPHLDVGTIGVRAGPITSAVDRVRIALRGPGGHTARPNRTVDLVTVASRVVTDLTLAVSRLTDMRGAANLTFGAIHAGTSANVIPREAELLGSFRTVDRSTWDAAPDLLARLLRDSVRLYGAECELDHTRGHPPVVNDAGLAARVRRVVRESYGPDAVVEADQSLGGDDFAWFLEDVPGCYMRLGARDPDSGAEPIDLHGAGFDVDERAIGVGVRVMAAVVLDAAAGAAGS